MHLTRLPASNGRFHLLGGDSHECRGDLTLADTGRASVTIDTVLGDDPTVQEEHNAGQYHLAISADPDRQVRSFAPRDVLGTLDTGELVSLLRAQNHGGTGHHSYPRFESRMVILGAHVTEDQCYTAIRIHLGDSWWLRHLTDGERCDVVDDCSTLHTVIEDAACWLVYQSSTPLRLDQLARRVISACESLAWLVLDQNVKVVRTQVRVADADPWLRVYGSQFENTADSELRDPWLIGPENLTVERFARWIDVHEQLDGLDWAVEELSGGGPVQVRTLLGSTLIEGFHRRLRKREPHRDEHLFSQRRFPDSSAGSLRSIRRAAVFSAVEEARKYDRIDPEIVGTATRDALGHLGDVSFRDRVDDVLATVSDVVPEMIESLPDTARFIKNARNDLAHHLRGRDGQRDDSFLRWTVAAHALPWLLRPFLLTLADFDHQFLYREINDYQRYGFACANVRLFLRDLADTSQ